MLLEPPLWLSVLVLGGAVLSAGAVWTAVLSTARGPASATAGIGATRIAIGLFLGVWLALAIALSGTDFFLPDTSRTVPTIATTGIPLVLGAIALFSIPAVWRVLSAIPLSTLIGVQVYRALGLVFVLLWATGWLPPAFALPAGLGDVAVGIAAPWVAHRVRTGAPNAALIARLWILAGVLDLVLSITLGMLTSPGPLNLLAKGAPNEMITSFPLVLIPAFAVPLFLLLHLVAWRSVSRMPLR
ncbi:hypothetical protein [Streptomyces sp. NBC_00233]|uniref:hypothetical protein n=1 Tax=Streptomyces sp. NBC_00233 TaxID=2975686 RepID=UPI002251280C|nr:hypothetical protein [Streptomyces sp. NBC_00233]MCX5233368.1 hypothetical protein [Streptomyces sp. NBC_00233]